MERGSFRFAVILALSFTASAFIVAWVYDLPLRDPDDGIAGPAYVRLPLIVVAALLADIVPRAIWRARRTPSAIGNQLGAVVTERWTWPHLRFLLIGLGAWYLTYFSFRNLKSAVPFVNHDLWDTTLERIDRVLWFGNDPAMVLHNLFGTGFAAHFFAWVYVIWLGFIPVTLAIALAWTRAARASAWFVTAIAVDWVLGAIVYFMVPSLGPVYSRPEWFANLPETVNSPLVRQLMDDRLEVIHLGMNADTVQTIAAFASLHVGLTVSVVVMAELLRFHTWIRASLWTYLGLTILATIYLGWHFSVDAIGGAALGFAGVAIAAWGTGNSMRRVPKKTRDTEPEPAAIEEIATPPGA
ncbi:MAG: phosphatase PAP2 family protein [Nocardioidaceae bacterium]|nr:MAG: phosphatase PAP2 family protein [Nocardioidaceae bacterium]